ncbi:MAG: FAD:protein FMN transferase [Mangrovicoccus sp.]
MTRFRPMLASWLALGAAFALCALLSIAAWQKWTAKGSASSSFYVFGTLVEVVLYDIRPEQAQTAFAGLSHDFRQMHRDWHAWRDGELTRLNRQLAQGQAMQVSPALAQLLRQGQALSAASDGLFNPAIGRLIAAWGFHDDLPPEAPLPAPAHIAELVAANPRMSDLEISPNNIVSSRNTALALDLGAYAKGAALDLAAAKLERLGIRHAVLNAGGDVTVMGRHGARPWRVAIRDPFGWGAIAALDVQAGESVYTSGNYERFLDQDGARFSHILDPRNGWALRDVVSVTVLAENGALADAAATALSVAGAQDFARIAAAMGTPAALLINDQGQLFATPAMAARLDLLGADQSLSLTTLPLARNLLRETDRAAAVQSMQRISL